MIVSLVILDRDGVINHDSPSYVRSLSDWAPIDGSIEAIAQLLRAGYQVAVATNQAGVPKGFIPECELEAMHTRLRDLVRAASGHEIAIYDCRHHPDEKCNCRKPKPGMLLAACADQQIPPHQALFLGDSWSDIMAARSAGCQPMLVLTGNGAHTAARDDFESARVPCIARLDELPAWLDANNLIVDHGRQSDQKKKCITFKPANPKTSG